MVQGTVSDGQILSAGSLNEIPKFLDAGIALNAQNMLFHRLTANAAVVGMYPENFFYNSAGSINTATTTFELGVNAVFYHASAIYDTFNNSSFDNALWASGAQTGSVTITENAGSMVIGYEAILAHATNSGTVLSTTNFSGCSYLVLDWRCDTSYTGGGNQYTRMADVGLTNSTTGSFQRIGSAYGTVASAAGSGLFVIEFLTTGSYAIWRVTNASAPTLITTLYGLGAIVKLKFGVGTIDEGVGTAGNVSSTGFYAGYCRTGSPWAKGINFVTMSGGANYKFQGLAGYNFMNFGQNVISDSMFYSRFSTNSGATFNVGSNGRAVSFGGGSSILFVPSITVTGGNYPAVYKNMAGFTFDSGLSYPGTVWVNN